MLSSLPKLADRNFIIGFFVPTLLTALATLWLFRDVEAVRQVYEAVWNEKKWEEITIFALAVWVFSMLLMLINHQLYRVVEGYIGPLAWLGNRRLSRRRDAIAVERRELIQQEANEADQSKKERLNKRIDAIDLELANYFPHANFPVLPSRFGNAIRAFESYPPVVYGVDSIPAWIRLAALIPKQLSSATADARAEVDFFLNTFMLSLVLMIVALGRFLFGLSDFKANCPACYTELQWTYLPCIGVCIVIAYLAYNGAVARAVAWGEYVKSAFDLYLPKLANALGYSLPDTLDKRREFWNAFSLMTLYFQPLDPSMFPALSKGSEATKPEGDDEPRKPNDDDEKDPDDEEKTE
jgi:hypothetical protein